jgi:hypothetical protein
MHCRCRNARDTGEHIYGKMFPKMQQRHTPLRILPRKRDILLTVPADKRRISTERQEGQPLQC